MGEYSTRVYIIIVPEQDCLHMECGWATTGTCLHCTEGRNADLADVWNHVMATIYFQAFRVVSVDTENHFAMLSCS